MNTAYGNTVVSLVGGLGKVGNSFFENKPNYSTVYLNAGDDLYSSDRLPEGLYFVQAGCLKVYLLEDSVRGRYHSGEFLVRLVTEGEYLDSKLLSDGDLKKYRVVAMTPAMVFYYSPAAIEEMLRTADPVVRALLKQRIDSQRGVDENSHSLYLASIRERVAHQLVLLANRFGVKGPSGISLNLQLTRYELGQLAGTVNESFSRYLSEFKDQGLVDIKGREIIIKNLAALAHEAGEVRSR
ncbi:Crp/Fnr family transcriptional regulator [Bdellovibrio svalbardensis]|uniref:Crp/Fnr family transcriptional regulator n=1 Tax=Bdellovibrio svalbardensis TaxID=2972972 RepID=A0ABT6DJE2_9BACT|nr:Crp/Fnr family transcriptional regulator [Bdellovibrio svalbardensis]MDG0815971.1 Crp/Fnr family transcriptional regulator [Bdellovibrio svalbardensis]